MALVERKIMLTHVSNAVKLFLNMNIDVNTLSVGECTALSQMKLLLESNAVKDIHNTAQLQEFTSIISHQHATEICCVCQATIRFTDTLADGCENGHVFSRCCQTLQLCLQVPYRKCSFCICLAAARHPAGNSRQSAWLAALQTERCTYCDGKLV